MMSNGTREEYEDYCDMLREKLYKIQEKYHTKPSRYRLLRAYKIVKELGGTIPDWISKDLEKLLDSLYDQEKKKRVHRTDRMKLNDYVKIASAIDSAAAKKAYKGKKHITLSAVEKRMKRFKKLVKKPM